MICIVRQDVFLNLIWLWICYWIQGKILWAVLKKLVTISLNTSDWIIKRKNLTVFWITSDLMRNILKNPVCLLVLGVLLIDQLFVMWLMYFRNIRIFHELWPFTSCLCVMPILPAGLMLSAKSLLQIPNTRAILDNTSRPMRNPAAVWRCFY